MLSRLVLASAVALGAGALAAAELPPTPEGDTGIASRFPMDQGIGNHPNVIFASGFENGFSGWTKHRQSGIHDVVRDPEIVHAGGACLRSTANRGKDSGGDCVYKLPRTVEKIHLRFYARFHKDTCIPHHFVKIRANPTGWWGGGAGYRPRGDKAFWTGIEPTKKHTWLFYTYWHKMRSWNKPDGRPNNPPRGTGRSFYGNTFHPDDQTPFKMDEWICVEAMMKCNTVGKSDGEKAFWIDGKKIGHWRPGEPVGSWIRDKFVTSGSFNRNPRPFEGFDFRSSEEVKFSAIALQWYVSAKVAQKAKTDMNMCYFDDVVVATEYIGPMVKERVAVAERPAGGSRPLIESSAAAPAPEELQKRAGEKEAGRLFQMARRAERMGQASVARKLYEQIIEKHPETEVAKKAEAKLN